MNGTTTPPLYIFYCAGAAIEEGSLKPGDRLLEVNDKCVDGMSQSDVVTLLRNVPLDSSVTLLVSRHSSAADGSDEADAAAAAAGKSPTKLKNNDANSGITSSEHGVGGPLVVPSTTTRKLQFQLDEKTDEEEVINCETLGSSSVFFKISYLYFSRWIHWNHSPQCHQ